MRTVEPFDPVGQIERDERALERFDLVKVVVLVPCRAEIEERRPRIRLDIRMKAGAGADDSGDRFAPVARDEAGHACRARESRQIGAPLVEVQPVVRVGPHRLERPQRDLGRAVARAAVRTEDDVTVAFRRRLEQAGGQPGTAAWIQQVEHGRRTGRIVASGNVDGEPLPRRAFRLDVLDELSFGQRLGRLCGGRGAHHQYQEYGQEAGEHSGEKYARMRWSV